MRHTIEGFSQEYAITLKKEINHRKSTKIIKIDCTDLVILRWFVDFYPRMKKVEINGQEYAWLTHSKVLADLPLLDINQRSIIERMQKLVEFNILTYKFVNNNGGHSYYGFGENYINLINTNENSSVCSNVECSVCSNVGGVYVQTYSKDNTIKDNSIKDNKADYAALVNEFFNNEPVKTAINTWLDYKKENRQAYKPTGLKVLLARLKKDADNFGEQYVIDEINHSIGNRYAGIYAEKIYQKPKKQEFQRHSYSDIALTEVETPLEAF